MGNTVGLAVCCSPSVAEEATFTFSPRPLVASFDATAISEAIQKKQEVTEGFKQCVDVRIYNEENVEAKQQLEGDDGDAESPCTYGNCRDSILQGQQGVICGSASEANIFGLNSSEVTHEGKCVLKDNQKCSGLDSLSDVHRGDDLCSIADAAGNSYGNGLVYHDAIRLEEEKATYTGQWRGKVREGFGILVAEVGEYRGKFENGVAHGLGKFVNVNGDVYVGNWKHNKPWGFGLFQKYKGTFYAGEWVDNAQHGMGKEIWPDGCVYVGAFENGAKNGHGKLQWPDNFVYEGNFVKNRLNGMGCCRWPDGKTYNGFWVDGRFSGFGTMEWAAGTIFSGYFENCAKHGPGVVQYSNGDRFAGVWVDNAAHGVMSCIKANGRTTLSLYEGGKFIKELTESEAASYQSSYNAKFNIPVTEAIKEQHSKAFKNENDFKDSNAATSAEASRIDTTSSSTEEIPNPKVFNTNAFVGQHAASTMKPPELKRRRQLLSCLVGKKAQR